MERFTSINNIRMIQCGDYNWEIVNEGREDEGFSLVIFPNEEMNEVVCLYFKNNILSITDYNTETRTFKFKMGFNETPLFVNCLLQGENCKLMPLNHKDTVKKK